MNSIDLFKCLSCGTLFPSPDADLSTNQELYEQYYENANFEISEVSRASLLRYVKTFEAFRTTGKLIEIGYGEGFLLEVAAGEGWKCHGVELSPHALETAERKGWTVSDSLEDTSKFPREGFDVVVMTEFIEHVMNPDYFVEQARSLLRPGGLLFITTPNAKGLNCRVLGADWSVIVPPEHLVIWSPKGISKALGRFDFRVDKTSTDGMNPFDILRKLKGGQRSETGVAGDRNSAAAQLNASFHGSPWKRQVKSAVNGMLSALRLGDDLKVWAIKN